MVCLQSRQPQSCHVQSRAGHRRRPLGHLWRRGQPLRGPWAPLFVWMTALWAGHGLSVRDRTFIHTAMATTTNRYPRWARHWPPCPAKQWLGKWNQVHQRKQSLEKNQLFPQIWVCCACQSVCICGADKKWMTGQQKVVTGWWRAV